MIEPLLTLQAIDGELYDKVRNSYVLYAQIEADCCNAVKAECEDLREKAALVIKEGMNGQRDKGREG